MSTALDRRVDALERGQQAMGDAVEQVRCDVATIGGQVGMIGGKLDKLVETMSSTDERAGARAHAVKAEIRDESDRKAKDRDGLFKNGIALLGAIGLVVSAFGAPWLGMLHSTASGQADDAKAIAAIRELVATDRADITRQRDFGEIQRDRNKIQDGQLFDLGQRLARVEERTSR